MIIVMDDMNYETVSRLAPDRELRLLDNTLQATNWTADLME